MSSSFKTPNIWSAFRIRVLLPAVLNSPPPSGGHRNGPYFFQRFKLPRDQFGAASASQFLERKSRQRPDHQGDRERVARSGQRGVKAFQVGRRPHGQQS